MQRGSAMELPLPDGSLDAVVTDPPLRRNDQLLRLFGLDVRLAKASACSQPTRRSAITTDPNGLQEKTNEAVIKCGSVRDDHRTEGHYKSCITRAFKQARLKVGSEGVVSIVFGHGDPRCLGAGC